MDEQQPAKRPRVALACQRCKTRKQKCNGAHPTCYKCQSLGLECSYIIPQKHMPFGQKQYITALEQRVAELESCLATNGISGPSNDHWEALYEPLQSIPRNFERNSNTFAPNSSNTDVDHGFGNESGSKNDGEKEEVESLGTVLRDLSLDANGGYIGASSHVTMGSLFGPLAGVPQKRRQGRPMSDESLMAGSLTPPSAFDSEESGATISLAEVPATMANRLLFGYLKHISTRWPVVHSVWVQDLHSRRNNLTSLYEETMLHLIYANAGGFLETTGESGPFHADRHYSSALQHIEDILSFHDLRSLSALMLMAVYCLRTPVGPGAWTYSRLAMLLAIDLGLHREIPEMKQGTLAAEMRKRVFWACYHFDRQISIPLGRPFGISDRDIDVPFPLDVDEATTDPEILRNATLQQIPEIPRLTSTTLSPFIQLLRLRRIESDIQQSVYRVDNTEDTPDSEIDQFLEKLENWKLLIPLDARTIVDAENTAFDGYEYYMVFYYKCLRLLLYPQISKKHVTPRFLKACAESCAGVCGTYKRLHQSMAVGYSMMSLQTVFMAGLTLVYCVWISPGDIFNPVTSNGISDCSILLFVMAERVPMAKKYRNAFEVIRQKVIDQIANGANPAPRETVGSLAEQLQSPVYSFDANQPFDIGHDSYEQYWHIMNDMTGETFNFSDDSWQA